MSLAIVIIGALNLGDLPLRHKCLNEASRWAWWKEFHQRMRRYPTAQEVDNWIKEQSGATTS